MTTYPVSVREFSRIRGVELGILDPLGSRTAVSIEA
jgi:hypothetical protein